jgi:Zn-dependent protease
VDFERVYMLLARALVLFAAMPVHEWAHGYMAYRLGDDSPRRDGRLSLNPFRHLDLLGSIMILFAGIGWAKPVMVDPRNFKNPKWGMALTAMAGPLSNLVMALLVMVLYKLFMGILPSLRFEESWADFFYLLVVMMLTILETNIRLAVFNLLPVPPLDGSKLFGAILPERLYFFLMRYERYVGLALMALIFLGFLSGPLDFLSSGVERFLDFLSSPLGRMYGE